MKGGVSTEHYLTPLYGRPREVRPIDCAAILELDLFAGLEAAIERTGRNAQLLRLDYIKVTGLVLFDYGITITLNAVPHRRAYHTSRFVLKDRARRHSLNRDRISQPGSADLQRSSNIFSKTGGTIKCN